MSQRLPWNIQSFLKPTEKSEIGRNATINRFKKLFSFTGNDNFSKDILDTSTTERGRTSYCGSKDEKFEKPHNSPRDLKTG